MSGPKKLGWLAGGRAARAAGRARWWRLRSRQWGQWVRRCAAPRQTQWSGSQGRAACGSRWRGHAVAGGWRYLWMDGALGEWGLAARTCWWVCVRYLWCSCVPCRCCALWMVCRRGGNPVLGGMAWGRFSWLVEQEFEEVGLVRLGQSGCMLQVFVGAVCELLRCLGNGRPLHVHCRGLGGLPRGCVARCRRQWGRVARRPPRVPPFA